MLGFVASLVGEQLTGTGALHQLSSQLGVSVPAVTAGVMGLALANTTIALLPGATRDEPAPAVAVVPTNFGFTPENEIFVGRVANMGWLMSIVGEWFTGKGALEQMASETSLPVTDIEFIIGVMAMLMLTTAVRKN